MNDQLISVYQYKFDLWKDYVLFSWQWWLGILLTIIPTLLWFLFHNRDKTAKLLLAGLTAALTSAFLDTTCLFFGLFDYRYEVTPMGPNYIPWNFFVIPVLVIFSIQLYENVNIYLKGLMLSLLMAFIGLPILKYLGIFKTYEWNYFYSFIILFIIFILSYKVSTIADGKKHKH